MKRLRTFLPLFILASGLLLAGYLVGTRPKAVPMERGEAAPPVRVLEVVPEDMRLRVEALGEVRPRAEIDLVAEVTGRIVATSASLESGAFFAAGEELARIDPIDYELAVRRARADVAQARVEVETELAEAEVARSEWDDLHGGNPPPLVVREPQLAGARARLEAARASLAQAEVDLARTVIEAPFAGRVRSENVDVGQFVSRGASLARIYAIDAVEVRLPLSTDDLAFVDLPLRADGLAGEKGPSVDLRASIGGREHHWRGRIVRTEGELDPRTRMLHAVVRVEDPYRLRGGETDAPLAIGLYVAASISGRAVEGVFVVPRDALRDGADGAQVLVIDEESRVRLRPVEVLREQADTVLIASGLRGGERICVSHLEVAVEGMLVRVVEDVLDPAAPGASAGADPGRAVSDAGDRGRS